MNIKKYMILLIVLIFSLVFILPASATDHDDMAVGADDTAVDETISENVKMNDELESVNLNDSDDIQASANQDSDLNGASEDSFTALQEKIANADEGATIDLEHGYVYDSGFTTDGIKIEKDRITINGNGHTIDASNKARIFNTTGNNIFITNLTIINGFSEENGGAIILSDMVTLINVTLKNNHANQGGAIFAIGMLNIENCSFDNNTADDYGGCIKSEMALSVSNSNFTNSKSKYCPAIYSFKNLDMGIMLSIENCTFENLTAEESAGAVGIKHVITAKIINCTFINTSSKRNGGALLVDSFRIPGDVVVENSTFINSRGDYGGALLILGSNLNMQNCEFINNTALYDGGAIYASCCDINIENTTISGNRLIHDEEGNGGGIYIDYSTAYILNCTITDNTKNGIYAYDKDLTVENTTFAGNGEAIHGVFLDYEPINVTTGNDTICVNDTNYFSAVSGIGKEIVLVNNTIDIVNLPSRYDSRDWGWVTPVKRRGTAVIAGLLEPLQHWNLHCSKQPESNITFQKTIWERL